VDVPAPLLVAAALVGYLAGSVSFARLVARRFLPGRDVETTTYLVDDAGATMTLERVGPSAIRERAGPRAGCATAALEIAKALVPTLAFRLADPTGIAAAACATGAVVGHVLPIWHRFRGGYGVSPLLGGLVVLDPLATVALPSAGLGLGLVVADAFVAFDVWPLLLIPWALWRGEPALLAMAVVANVVFWWAELPKLRRHLAHRRATRKDRRGRIAEITFVMGGRPPAEDPSAGDAGRG
jgi:glycerol-3-phosphate acyltransferase PlsY